MAVSNKEALLAYLGVLDEHLVESGHSTSIYLSGGAAVILAYGGTERTKDVDAVVNGRDAILDDLQAWAGRGTPVARREGLFFEVVPPIFPAAPDMFSRARPIEGVELRAIRLFVLELHDLIITKLGRYWPKDRSDIELLTRDPDFNETELFARYAAARDALKFYAPDAPERTDENFNRLRREILGLPKKEWDD